MLDNIIKRIDQEIRTLNIEEKSEVRNILKEDLESAGHFIVDYLDVPRRYNRRHIYRIIEESKTHKNED